MATKRTKVHLSATPWADELTQEDTMELPGEQRLRPQQFAANLKRLRQARGLSLEQLAARAQLRLVSLEAYESGRVWPPLVHGQLLADALGTRIPVLLGLEEPRRPPPAGRLDPELVATLAEQAEQIAALERALATTQAAEKRWMGLAEAVTEGVMLHDGTRVLDVNPRFAELFGYEREKALGRPLLDFVAHSSRAQVTRVLRAGAETPYELVALKADGAEVRVIATPRRLGDGRRIVAFRVLLPTALP